MDGLMRRTPQGFYTLAEIPDPAELQKYYAEKYYQEARGSYEKSYTAEEIRYINNKVAQKFQLLKDQLPRDVSDCAFLDIGCGEGWALAYFKLQGWEVTGVDYSDYGCASHNPQCLPWVVKGDIYQSLDALIEAGQKFHCLWMDNVLEHVPDPAFLLDTCMKLMAEYSVLVIEVPNDYSAVQNYLISHNRVSVPYWVAPPDHISYFTRPSLEKLAGEAGLACITCIGDFPIEWFLFNDNTNYIEDKNKGKSCHFVRVELENLMHDLSVEKTNRFYEALADLGMGRTITGFFRRV